MWCIYKIFYYILLYLYRIVHSLSLSFFLLYYKNTKIRNCRFFIYIFKYMYEKFFILCLWKILFIHSSLKSLLLYSKWILCLILWQEFIVPAKYLFCVGCFLFLRVFLFTTFTILKTFPPKTLMIILTYYKFQV